MSRTDNAVRDSPSIRWRRGRTLDRFERSKLQKDPDFYFLSFIVESQRRVFIFYPNPGSKSKLLPSVKTADGPHDKKAKQKENKLKKKINGNLMQIATSVASDSSLKRRPGVTDTTGGSDWSKQWDIFSLFSSSVYIFCTSRAGSEPQLLLFFHSTMSVFLLLQPSSLRSTSTKTWSTFTPS